MYMLYEKYIFTLLLFFFNIINNKEIVKLKKCKAMILLTYISKCTLIIIRIVECEVSKI